VTFAKLGADHAHVTFFGRIVDMLLSQSVQVYKENPDRFSWQGVLEHKLWNKHVSMRVLGVKEEYTCHLTYLGLWFPRFKDVPVWTNYGRQIVSGRDTLLKNKSVISEDPNQLYAGRARLGKRVVKGGVEYLVR